MDSSDFVFQHVGHEDGAAMPDSKGVSPKANARVHLISLMPGEAYISSCRWPLRKRYSIAAKSFLSLGIQISILIIYRG